MFNKLLIIGCGLIGSSILRASIKKKIANQLGSPWRNLMTRFWETENTAKNENMYSWHTDGMPHEFFKIMLYFNVLKMKEKL